jgi:hypothetical protein
MDFTHISLCQRHVRGLCSSPSASVQQPCAACSLLVSPICISGQLGHRLWVSTVGPSLLHPSKPSSSHLCSPNSGSSNLEKTPSPQFSLFSTTPNFTLTNLSVTLFYRRVSWKPISNHRQAFASLSRTSLHPRMMQSIRQSKKMGILTIVLENLLTSLSEADRERIDMLRADGQDIFVANAGNQESWT